MTKKTKKTITVITQLQPRQKSFVSNLIKITFSSFVYPRKVFLFFFLKSARFVNIDSINVISGKSLFT